MSKLLSQKELILKNNSYLYDYGYIEFGLTYTDYEDVNWEDLNHIKNRKILMDRIIEIADCVNEGINMIIDDDPIFPIPFEHLYKGE